MASKAHLPRHFQNWNNSRNPSVVRSLSIEEAPHKRDSQKPIYKRLWFIATVVAVIAAIILVIVVPVAVILSKKGKNEYHAAVMLPLYIYPQDNTTWAPLYQSLSTKPELSFTVIINPSSGPGSSPYPDEQYSNALHQLATYPNVKKIGYVRTGYASRNLSDVISELNVYAGWASRSPAFAMDGIFFDESPHQFTQDAVDFMNSASRAVKSAEGLRGSREVIRNPGVIPDAAFKDANTDITVVFEQSYDEYRAKESDLATILKDDRSHNCYMVHSLPEKNNDEMRDYLHGLSKRAQYLFVTNNNEQYYEKFGSDWSTFTETIRA